VTCRIDFFLLSFGPRQSRLGGISATRDTSTSHLALRTPDGSQLHFDSHFELRTKNLALTTDSLSMSIISEKTLMRLHPAAEAGGATHKIKHIDTLL